MEFFILGRGVLQRPESDCWGSEGSDLMSPKGGDSELGAKGFTPSRADLLLPGALQASSLGTDLGPPGLSSPSLLPAELLLPRSLHQEGVKIRPQADSH